MLRIWLFVAVMVLSTVAVGQTSAEPRGDMGQGCGASC